MHVLSFVPVLRFSRESLLAWILLPLAHRDAFQESPPAATPLPAASPGPRELRAQAQALLDDEHFTEARALLEPAVAAASAGTDETPAALREKAAFCELLGDACWRGGGLERAGELYLEALAINPKAILALIGVTRWHLARGDEEAALEVSGQGIEAGPALAEPWLLRAAALIKARRLPEAFVAREQGLRLLAATRRNGTHEPRRLRSVLEVLRAAGVTPTIFDRGGEATRLLYELKGGVPVINVRIARPGGPPLDVPMVLDTGGTWLVALDDGLKELLDVPAMAGIQVEGIRGVTGSAESAVLPDIELGEWHARQVPALFYPVPSDERLRALPAPPYRGILGTALFEELVLAFHPRNQLCLVRRARRGHSLFDELGFARNAATPFYLIGDGKVIFGVECDGERCLALLDSGAAASCVSERFARAHLAALLDDPAEPKAPLVLRIGDKTVPFAPAAVQRLLDENVSPQLGVEVSLLIGMDFLQRFVRFAVDYRNQEVAFLAARSP